VNRSIRILLPLLVLAFLAQARAQYMSSYGYNFNNPVSATCNSIMWSRMNSRMVYRTVLKRKGYTDAQLERMSSDQMEAALGGQKTAAAEAQKPVQAAATVFRPTGGRLLLPAMAKSLVKDREQQQALLEVFEQGMQGYEKEAAASGLKNDLAGAIVYLIGSSYYVFNDGREPDANGTEILARVLQRTLDTPEFRQVANADKQRFYEFAIGLGTYLGVSYQQAAAGNDQAWIGQLKEGAEAALKGFLKLDPKTVRITSSGLEVAR
jgi:hypothetical protein